ncbi:Uncharacterised protein [Candidatus Bilamarchaeum dharawalense]|uniref:Uncharacterized protein n=1 Tax=Candidatus Bilamarchaeum dharawalense TaxID=2885759 RepID=A0A5E4LQ81_9ARCH|nr:Uncharacterised protein [Candidatus Bilamarchaeum dharawalense]
MKRAFFILLFICIAFAGTPFFNSPSQPPLTGLTDQISLLFQFVVPLMFIMIILAAAAYVGGQLFGTETRAKASVWSQSMLTAVGIVALILFLIYAVLPGFFSGQLSSAMLDLYNPLTHQGAIPTILSIAQTGFAVLILVMIIIAAVIYVLGPMFGSETRARAAVWSNNLLAASILGAALYLIIYNVIIPIQVGIFTQPIAVGQCSGGASLGLYGGILVDVCILVSIIILVTYMLSRFLKVPEWEAYLNIELSNLMSSFVVIIFVIGLFATGSAVTSTWYDSVSYCSAAEAAIAFMSSSVSESALKASMDVYKIQACTSMLSTFSRRTGEFVLTQTYKVFPGVDTFVSVTNVLSFTLISFYSTISVQIALLHLVQGLMIPFFLPAGLILRFFPPTRDAGAFLISLAFGFQFLFPTLYIINGQIFNSIGGEPYRSPETLINFLCGPLKYGAAGYLFNPNASPLFKIPIPGFSTLLRTLGTLTSEGLLNAVSMSEFIPILEHIASLSLLVLFMPALAMMVTISFINVMTKFIITKG